MNYRLSEETIIHEGVTLHRIVCTKTFNHAKEGEKGGFIEKESNLSDDAWVFGNAKVHGKAQVFDNARVCDNALVYGDAVVFGNAHVCDNARVFDNAIVCGDAQVNGNALVSGNALVFGDAVVCGKAQVYDNARVLDDARVCDNAQVLGNALVLGKSRVSGNDKVNYSLFSIKGSKHTVSECGDGEIKIGCQRHDINAWLLLFGDIGKKNNYTEKEIQEYKCYLDCIARLQEIRNNKQ